MKTGQETNNSSDTSWETLGKDVVIYFIILSGSESVKHCIIYL